MYSDSGWVTCGGCTWAPNKCQSGVRDSVDSHLVQLLCSLLAEADRASPNDVWHLEKEVASNVECRSASVTGFSLRKFRAIAEFDCDSQRLAAALWEPATRLTWDVTSEGEVDLQSYAAVDAAADVMTLRRLKMKATLLIGQRDFCNFQVRSVPVGIVASCPRTGEIAMTNFNDLITHPFLDPPPPQMKRNQPDGCILSVSMSVTHPSCPVDKDYVRGEVLPGSGWHIQPLAPSGTGTARCKLTYVIFTDIKGWIPQWTVNAAMADTFANYYRHLSSFMARQRPADIDGIDGDGGDNRYMHTATSSSLSSPSLRPKSHPHSSSISSQSEASDCDAAFSSARSDDGYSVRSDPCTT